MMSFNSGADLSSSYVILFFNRIGPKSKDTDFTDPSGGFFSVETREFT